MSDEIKQITEDHTFVQREINAGRLSPDEAEFHPKKNVILKCMGVMNKVDPAYYQGKVKDNTSFLICCDGFRHKNSSGYILNECGGSRFTNALDMKRALVGLTEHAKQLGEKDNITSVLIMPQK